MNRPPGADDPLWTKRELAISAVVAAIGAIALMVCWYRGSGVRTFEKEKSWLVACAMSAGIVVAALFHRVYTGLRRLRDVRQDSVARSLRLLPGAAREFYLDAAPEFAVAALQEPAVARGARRT